MPFFSDKHHKAIFAVISAVSLVILLVVIFEIIGWPFLKSPIQNFMQTKLERTIKIDGAFSIRLFGGIRIKADSFWISAPDGFGKPYLADAKQLELNLRYSDLWNIKPGDPYLIKAIKVEDIAANLGRHLNGDSTWQFKKDPNDPIRPFPVIQTLVVRHGQALVKDELTKADLTIHFATEEGSNNKNPTSKVSVDGNFRDRKLASELTTQGFLPIASQTVNSPPVSSKGWLEFGGVRIVFDGSVYDLFGAQNVKGSLKVSGNSLGVLGDLLSITLPTTTPFKIDGDVEKNTEGWTINVASLTVGKSDLAGRFHYDPRPDKASLEGNLKGKKLILADLAPAFGSNPDEPGQKSDRIFPDKPLDFATYNRMNAKIDIDLDYVDLGKAFREPITPFKANLDLNKNKLSLAKLSAKTAEGSISGSIYIDAHDDKVANPEKEKTNPEKPKPEWAIDLTVQDIDLGKWLQISDKRKQDAKTQGKDEQSEAYVTGLLNGRIKLNGNGRSTAELIKTLNGKASVYVENGTISHLVIEAVGIDLAQAFGLLIKGDQPLTMQCSILDFDAKDGIVSPNEALIDTSVTTVYVGGQANLGEETLDLSLIAKPKNFSPFTARSPILITGTLAHPQVSPKKGPIAARAIGAVALAVVNPLAAILPFIDPGSSKSKTGGCDQSIGQIKQSQQSSPTIGK